MLSMLFRLRHAPALRRTRAPALPRPNAGTARPGQFDDIADLARRGSQAARQAHGRAARRHARAGQGAHRRAARRPSRGRARRSWPTGSFLTGKVSADSAARRAVRDMHAVHRDSLVVYRSRRSLARSAAGLAADLAGAPGDVLHAGQGLESHRAPGVQLLRGDPDLQAVAELAPVGEPGRAVHEHAARVDRPGEPARPPRCPGRRRPRSCGFPTGRCARAPRPGPATTRTARIRSRYSVPQSLSLAGSASGQIVA